MIVPCSAFLVLIVHRGHACRRCPMKARDGGLIHDDLIHDGLHLDGLLHDGLFDGGWFHDGLNQDGF